MNIFDYRKKKDLQGRTTQFRMTKPALAASEPPARPLSFRTSQSTKKQAGYDRNTPSHNRRLRNVSQDQWYYSSSLKKYQELVNGATKIQKTNSSETTPTQLTPKYAHLLNDWFVDELIQEIRRRDAMHIIHLAKPAWALLPVIVVLAILTFLFPAVWYALLVLLMIEFGLFAWYVNDWRNDYLIITNRRIVQIEKVTFFDLEKTEIPLEKIQEVKVEARRNALEYIFEVGTIIFISSGKTQIKFEQVRKPEELRTVVEGMTRSFFMARNSFRKDRTRNYLEAKISGTPLRDWYADEEPRVHSAVEEPGWWQRTFPTRPVHDITNKRYIWYTHPWVLIKQIFGPALLIFLVGLGGLFAIPFLITLQVGVLTGLLILAYLLTLMALLGVCWYKYENWHNDRYILTYAPFQERVLNIVRLPFGFDETVNTVLVRNIQDVQSERSGMVANILNFGRVKISVTGGPGIEVKNVPDPEEIRDEIARRIELAKYAQEDVEDRRMADSLVALRDIMYKELFQLWQDQQPIINP